MEDKQKIMVLAEMRGSVVHPVTFELLAWGRQLADQLNGTLACTVLGGAMEANRSEFNKLVHQGADLVLCAGSPSVIARLLNTEAGLLVRVVREEKPSVLIAAATTFGRTLMPIAAARLGTGLTADCTQLAIEPGTNLLLQTRPAIGGNVMATIKTPTTRPQMATVRPRSILPPNPDPNRQGEIIFKNYDATEGGWWEKFISFTPAQTKGVNLEAADIVVTCGKGMKTKENFSLVEELANLLGAGLGATRDVVDAGWAPFTCQIGLTGKTVAPKVYIAAGVSGKIQHLAGMITSEYIIAINSDPGAQIFQVADLGLISDAPAMVAQILKSLKEKRQAGEGSEND